MENQDVVKAFITLGLTEQKAKETVKNPTVTKILLSILNEVRGVRLPEGAGMLLYQLGTQIKPQSIQHLPFLVKYVSSKKLDSKLRVDTALDYVLAHPSNINITEFESYCGVGVVVTPEEIEKIVEKHINYCKDEIVKMRYKFNTGILMQKIKLELPWADGKAVKNEIDLQIIDLLGLKTEADLAPVSKADKKSSRPPKIESNQKKHSEEKEVLEVTKSLSILDVMKKVNFHAPGENYKTEGYVITENTHKLLQEHLKHTKGQVRTRFPPEPNGILHIGHAKAININFGYAAVHNGLCFLRYDDTNPEKEEEKFFIGIKDMVEWLGYEPYKITHSSDYFDQLYILALQLIKNGLAYVCHQSADEMKGFNPQPSPWRNRPIEENLQLFEDMKNGKIDEGVATLRMKVTLEEGKLDPVAYRVKFIPHHRTGDKWCIYPTYDYTHCLVDSLENITHSLCTKEFQSRRSSYYWLCNALNMYCPVQWEYGRLNVNYTVVSKRKIAKLISEGIVQDWDDPRLFTLTALRRRGFPPEAINNFCAQLGVTGAQSTVDPSMLEAFVRDILNSTAPRHMVVLEPLRITIKNFPHSKTVDLEVPNFPNKPELGYHKVKFGKVLYIEKSDFVEIAGKDYRRLTKTQNVGLRHAGFVLSVVDIVKNENEINEIICECIKVEKAHVKPKAFIHWVSEPFEVEVRVYSSLFKHKNPEDAQEVPCGFLSDCNLESLKIFKGYADESILPVKSYEKFQFERIGFFSVDPDTTKEKPIFNQTVGLKEDAKK